MYSINIYTPDTCPRSSSCCHDSSYTVPASWTHPRTASHPHGAAQYGLLQKPSPACPVPGNGHTADVLSGTCFLLCATGCHTHARMTWHGLPCAMPRVLHNISQKSVPDTPDAYRVSSVSSAQRHLLSYVTGRVKG